MSIRFKNQLGAIFWRHSKKNNNIAIFLWESRNLTHQTKTLKFRFEKLRIQLQNQKTRQNSENKQTFDLTG